MSVYADEIFGPLLSVIRAGSYDEALGLVNANPYSNGAPILTGDGGAARRFQNKVQVGMVDINVPIPVPVIYYSFGGWKSSRFRDTHVPGTDGVSLLHLHQSRHHPVARSQPRPEQPGLPNRWLTQVGVLR